jgi:hypothetical protein
MVESSAARGLKPEFFEELFAALKGRSSTALSSALPRRFLRGALGGEEMNPAGRRLLLSLARVFLGHDDQVTSERILRRLTCFD